MNIRHTNQCKQTQPKNPIQAVSRAQGPINKVSWLILLLMFSVLVLISERPALGGEFKIDAGPNGIKGYAQQVALEEILSYLAHKNGYVVQIDQALLGAPTTFHFPVALPAERAIQRIVHPHSLALVFTRIPGKNEPEIRQIRVFNKGNQAASYTMLSANDSRTSYSAHARTNAARSDIGGGQGVRSGLSAVHKHVKPPVTITKSAMGFTGFKFKDRRRGPDYRPDTLAMAQAYADYRVKRDALLGRQDDGELMGAKQKIEEEKNAYRAQRTPLLQKTINDSQN